MTIATLTIQDKGEFQQKARENYPNIVSKIEKLEDIPMPNSIAFFGSDSDSHGSTLEYSDGTQLYLFHRKSRSLLDAGFLEVSNLACLYGPSNKPIGGVRLIRGDRGERVISTALDYEKILPSLIAPAFLTSVSYDAVCQPFPHEKVRAVTDRILSCMEDTPIAVLHHLNDGKYVTKREQTDGIMNSLSHSRNLLQKFALVYR